MKYRIVYFLISAVVIGAGIFAYFKWGVAPGIDFKGGAIIEYKVGKDFSTEEAIKKIENPSLQIYSIQKAGEKTYLIRTNLLSPDNRENISTTLTELTGEPAQEVRFENVGPSIGPDLIKKTIYAIVIAALAILLWVAFQFKSFKFGVSAVLAMIHDSLVLLGSFALFGHFFGAEIDFLFVTAMLTILSFSVHDTIVVYDRIREMRKKVGGSMTEMANMAVSQTMVRSLNNSFTIIFMLVALILLGGTSIKWFAIALLVGTISGTYSSPFVAVPLLVAWDELQRKIKRV
ncbi:protein translocase subunit SecF [Candidatus Woesebacteria bacterium]|nr:protein translocase subunit SecF [Candidatus Woesebacteria bacterium]